LAFVALRTELDFRGSPRTEGRTAGELAESIAAGRPIMFIMFFSLRGC
jgi:hypothetical protein